MVLAPIPLHRQNWIWILKYTFLDTLGFFFAYGLLGIKLEQKGLGEFNSKETIENYSKM